MSNIELSFLVPTLGNRPMEIKRLFDSLCEQKSCNFEVVLIVQDNYKTVRDVVKEYDRKLIIKLIESEEKGLSKARNKGLPMCSGDIIVLSDDDCWYPNSAAEIISNEFSDNSIDVLITKIYDKKNERDYKNYGTEEYVIHMIYDLLSRSSIEIAFSNKYKDIRFDEQFGLGSQFICCEEVDFLLRIYKSKGIIKYTPKVTVFHDRKYNGSSFGQVVAKGALYAKHFNILTGCLVCLKDYIINKESNFNPFIKGFNEYRNKK